MDSFGVKFKKLRLLKDLTQEQLINDFNKKYHYSLTKSAISQYENDKRFPEITAMVDFADYFEVTLDFLLAKNHPKNKIVEEEVTNYVIEEDHDTFRLDEFFDVFDEKIASASRVVLFGKTATKKQLTILQTAIKLGLELSRKNDLE